MEVSRIWIPVVMCGWYSSMYVCVCKLVTVIRMIVIMCGWYVCVEAVGLLLMFNESEKKKYDIIQCIAHSANTSGFLQCSSAD